MEIGNSASGMYLAIGAAGLVLILWRQLNLLWIRPKKMEKIFRDQGFKGNVYRPPLGDAVEFIKLATDALSRPIGLSDDTLPRVLPFVHQIIQKHGNNSFGWLATTPWLIVMDSEKIKEILTRYEDFQKPSDMVTKQLITGLISYEEEKWVKHRKIINPAFNLEKLKGVLPVMQLSCQKMIDLWDELIMNNESCELDVCSYVENLTSDIISRAAFGSSYEEGRKIFDLQKEHLGFSKQMIAGNYIPGWRFLPTKGNRRIKAISNEIEALLKGIIEKRKLEVEKGGNNKADLLGILLESNFGEVQEHDNEKKSGLTIDEVVQECKLFYLAGAETTYSLLTWTLYLLSKHQDWQDRARTEILQVFGKDRNLSFDGLNQLKVMSMILNEAMRLYSPVSMLLRKVYKDTKLRDWSIPAGTEVVIPLSILHQDCEIWGEDAKEFNPQRFSQGVSQAMKKQGGVFMPFSSGPRVCVGQHFSLLEAKMSLTLILQRFSFRLSPIYVHAPYAVLTIKPQYSVNLILSKA